MIRSELRKLIIRSKEQLKEIKNIRTITSKERDNQTIEIKALEEKIKKLIEELYDDKTISRNK